MVSTEILQLLSALMLLVLISIPDQVETKFISVHQLSVSARGDDSDTPKAGPGNGEETATTLPPSATTLPTTTTTLPPTATGPCGYQRYHGGFYLKVNTTTLTYDAAEAACAAEGARVVNIKTADVQQAAVEAAIAEGLGPNNNYWIGLKYLYVDGGKWQWTDGTDLPLDANCATTNGAYHNWNPSSSFLCDANGEECAILKQDSQNYWEDSMCINEYYSICECEP